MLLYCARESVAAILDKCSITRVRSFTLLRKVTEPNELPVDVLRMRAKTFENTQKFN